MKRLRVLFLLLFVAEICFSQGRYFVDGYHGGVYGHYPLKWKTKFIVENLKKHPEWRIGLEIEPETWDSVRVATPDSYKEFAEMVNGNQIEFTNPSYAQPYCYNITGESIIRQFQYGIKKIHSHFPGVKFTTYSVEEPCFTSCLPTVLSQLGFKYASLKCPDTLWGGYTAAYGGELVNWIGPDGTVMLTVPRYECEELEENSTWQTKAWRNSREYFKACEDYGIKNPVGMCYQDAGWRNGPWIGDGKGTKYVLWTDYVENIADHSLVTDYKFTQEEVRPNLMWGSQVMQRIGRQVRAAENKMVMAEKMWVIGHLENGYNADVAQLDEGWRTLMLAQHHDSWIVPYNGLKGYGTWADAIKQWTDVSVTVADEVMAAVKNMHSGGYAVRVINTQASERQEVVQVNLPEHIAAKNVRVTDRNGKPVAFATEGQTLYVKAKVPAFGYTTYKIELNGESGETSAKKQQAKGGMFVLDNDMYSITFDLNRGGVVSSLVAKKCGNKEFVDASKDYFFGEMRGFFYERDRFVSSAESVAQIEVIEDNALVKKVALKGHIADHPFTKVITLRSGDAKIGVDLKIDWTRNEGIGEYKEKNWGKDRRAFCDDRYKLSVMFPAQIEKGELHKNAPFDVCKSKHENTFFNRWSEIKHNIILNWVDVVAANGKYGLALYSDHTTSYSYGADYPLALTLQYSGGGLWGRNYAITQATEVHYDIMPHRGVWTAAGVSEMSDALNEPLQAFLVADDNLEQKSYLQLPEGLMLSAANIDNGKMIVRLFNASGKTGKKRIMLDVAAESVCEADLLGNQTNALKLKREGGGKTSVSVDMAQFGIKTLEIKLK